MLKAQGHAKRQATSKKARAARSTATHTRSRGRRGTESSLSLRRSTRCYAELPLLHVRRGNLRKPPGHKPQHQKHAVCGDVPQTTDAAPPEHTGQMHSLHKTRGVYGQARCAHDCGRKERRRYRGEDLRSLTAGETTTGRQYCSWRLSRTQAWRDPDY